METTHSDVEQMNPAFYHKLCITNILKGVEEGLSKYSNVSRVAVIFVPGEHDPIRIFDPQNILREHESKLREIFCDHHNAWRMGIKEKIQGQPKGYMTPENDLSLAGLISYGCSSQDFFYQMWFTDHHPDMCSIHPTERWLEQAACLLMHDYNSRTAAINSSDYVLKNYSLQAIADYIVDEREKGLGPDLKILIPPILNDILNISKTREEGAWARGTLFLWIRTGFPRSLLSPKFKSMNGRSSGMPSISGNFFWPLRTRTESLSPTA